MENYTHRPTIIIPDYIIGEVPINVRARKMIVLSYDDEEYLRKWREKQKKRYKYFIGSSKDSDSKFIDPDPFEKWYIFYVRPITNTPRPSPTFSATSPPPTPLFNIDQSNIIKLLTNMPTMTDISI